MSTFFRISIATIVVVGFFHSAECQAQRQRGGSADVWGFIVEKYDKNNDGKLTKKEYDRSDNFTKFDRNKDGVLTKDDWATASGNSRGQRDRSGGSGASAPTQGDVAPDFELTSIRNSSETVRLSSFAGKKPVALIFGSCT